MKIKLIVGLANPGSKYIKMRHNAGSWYVRMLATKFLSPLKEEAKFYGLVSHINIAGIDLHLLIPTTFMNLSGKAVAAMARFYKISTNEILVAHDELDLPPGLIKFKRNSSYTGHLGLQDISSKLGNNSNFCRLRIGIGHPGDKKKVANFVLSEPMTDEFTLINKAIDEAICCTEVWVREGLDKAINRLHSFRA